MGRSSISRKQKPIPRSLHSTAFYVYSLIHSVYPAGKKRKLLVAGVIAATGIVAPISLHKTTGLSFGQSYAKHISPSSRPSSVEQQAPKEIFFAIPLIIGVIASGITALLRPNSFLLQTSRLTFNTQNIRGSPLLV